LIVIRLKRFVVFWIEHFDNELCIDESVIDTAWRNFDDCTDALFVKID
jgi:hypothetical protein